MAATTFYTPRWRAIDANGNPMNGAKLKFYEAGTATPLAVYSDVDLTISLGTTVTADAGGLFAEMFMLPQAYKIELYTSADVLVWSADDWLPPAAASATNADIDGTAAVALAAGELAYLSDGSGGLNAGEWYKADADLAYASESPELAFAVNAIAPGASGLFRTGGKITGLAGLTPGAVYYASGTAGAITTTPGAFLRQVGQADSTTTLVAQCNPPQPVTPASVKDICDGRLTLTTGTPVTTADVTAATTLYWALYGSNQVALYTGAIWVIRTLAELSIAVPNAASQMYDVFLDYNDGTPQLALTAWTNDTTRATALTKQDGVYVKTGDTQQRYVGSFRTTSVAGQTEDSDTSRFVWNYYNRVPRRLLKNVATNSWPYTTATWRQANGSAANQVAFVVGVAEITIPVTHGAIIQNNTGGCYVGAAIGFNSTTAPVTGGRPGSGQILTANEIVNYTGSCSLVPAVGYSYAALLEISQAVGATTWYSQGSLGYSEQTGLVGVIDG